MPDRSSDMKKTAIKIATGAALGGALGVAAALRTKQAAGSEQPAADGEARRVDGGAVREPPSPAPVSQPSDHPDWEILPATHLPRPTYWPVVLAAGVVFLAWGIVTTLTISLIGLALLALGLGGWIGELRHGQ